MKNNCGYSDEWSPYNGDYDKFEYDIKLNDGTIVENCYPNARKFNSISDSHQDQSFSEEIVSEIRFSAKPRFGINEKVSNVYQYEWLNNQVPSVYQAATQQVYTIHNPHRDLNQIHYPPLPKSERNKEVKPVRNSKTDPKIGRNEPCPCKSGSKYKNCCINKTK